MSQVSLSQLDYSAIRFSKTMTEEFDDLKKGQEALTSRLDGIKQWYMSLKEAKATGGNSEGEDTLHLSIQASQYCDTCANVIDADQSWMTDASRTIALFPSKCSVDRRRRTVDFVNKMKVLLRKTKPIGEDEGEEDAKWLETWVNELPEEPAASAAIIEEGQKQRPHCVGF